MSRIERNVDLPDLNAFQSQLSSLAEADQFSGAVAVTAGGEQIFGAAYGLANRGWRVPCTLDTRFDTASITKLFTAVAVLQSVERGDFGLDTPVVEYLELSGTTIAAEVTPYHLLTHTSGIADDADEESGEHYADLFIAEPNYTFTDTAAHLPHFATKPPNFAPGQGCRYCNAGYLLLGLMVERAARTSYRDYVSANVFVPAGMTQSGFLRMDVVAPHVAEGVEAILGDDQQVVGWRRNIYSYPPIGDPAGGAYVTVGDLLAFHRAVVGGLLLGPQHTAGMFVPREEWRHRPEWTLMTGYGFEFEVALDGDVRWYQKEGVNVGVSGVLRHYPKHDITLAILGIGERAVWGPVSTLDAAVDFS